MPMQRQGNLIIRKSKLYLCLYLVLFFTCERRYGNIPSVVRKKRVLQRMLVAFASST